MESSAQEALSIGANVFVFVIALTCGILLMTTVLNMSEAANEVMVTNTSSTLMELYGETTERVYTGEQVLAMFTNYVSETSNMKERIALGIMMGSSDISIVYKIEAGYLYFYDSNNNSLKGYTMISGKNSGNFAINWIYNLIYGGKDNSERDIYYFKRIAE